MARINIVVPRLARNTFTGGYWCIFEYAHGLVERGHDVTIVPTAPSPEPTWFPRPVGRIITSTAKERLGKTLQSALRVAWALVSERATLKSRIRETATNLCFLQPGLFSDPIRLGISEAYVTTIAPEADITVATSFETARPASLLTGRKFYFAQHYEPYFSAEYSDSNYAATVARQTYGLGFELIANSSWLQHKLAVEVAADVALCPNAIDHNVFYGQPKVPASSRKIVVISYGGRNAVWKGFREMALGMSMARAALPEFDIEWRVFGESLIAPAEITPFVPLGFLSPSRLREEYNNADLLLSASWYESFPMFPLEAMACCLAVITTQSGTEEYAFHEKTAEIVQPKDPQSIAAALIRLVKDEAYRLRLASAGNRLSRDFRWDNSVDLLENILLNRSWKTVTVLNTGHKAYAGGQRQ